MFSVKDDKIDLSWGYQMKASQLSGGEKEQIYWRKSNKSRKYSQHLPTIMKAMAPHLRSHLAQKTWTRVEAGIQKWQCVSAPLHRAGHSINMCCQVDNESAGNCWLAIALLQRLPFQLLQMNPGFSWIITIMVDESIFRMPKAMKARREKRFRKRPN